MNASQEDLGRLLAKAIVEWVDPDGNVYRDAFLLGAGGEGTTIVAERIAPKTPNRDPATSHVVFKLPIEFQQLAGRTPGSAWEILSDDLRCDGIRAEHKKRERLGNAPHMSQTPDLLEFPTDLFGRVTGLKVRYQEVQADTLIKAEVGLRPTMPILRTPLSRPRGGAIVPVSLDGLIPKHGCWSSRELLNWSVLVRALARALWSIHGRGWAHGDIKPANVVLYESRGRWHDVQLIDFGLVQPNFPGTLMQRGTFTYLRPERFRGQTPPGLTPATEDLYALGVTLVEVLLGKTVVNWLNRLAEPPKWGDYPGPFVKRYAELLRTRVRYELQADAYLFRSGPESHFVRNEYRVTAFRLCDRLLDWPDPSRSTIDVLRDLLAAVDMRLVGVGDPETMFTKLLVGLGAKQPGEKIRATRRAYRTVDPGAAPAASPPPTEDGAHIEQEVERAVEWLRRGRGAMAALHLKSLFDWVLQRPKTVGWIQDTKTAYELCQGLRLYCGIILVRERKLGIARKLLEELRPFGQKWPHSLPAIDDFIQWWIDHLEKRLILLEALHEKSLGNMLSQLRGAPPPPMASRSPDAIRAWDAAERWFQSFECDVALAQADAPIAVESLRIAQDRRESSHEAAYGAIQLMRAHGKMAQRQLDKIPELAKALASFSHPDLPKIRQPTPDLLAALFEFFDNRPEILSLIRELPDVYWALFERFPVLRSTLEGGALPAPPPSLGIVDNLWEAIYKFLLAIGWTIAGPMPHENALVLRHAAAILLSLFDSLERIIRETKKHLVLQSRGHDTQVPPYVWMFLIPKAHISIDVEAGLLGAASGALSAADAYRDLYVVPAAVASFSLAGQCYVRCSSPEHILDGLMWLSFAKNDLELWVAGGGPAVERDEGRDGFIPEGLVRRIECEIVKGINQWTAAARKTYKGTAGEDPASFVGRLFFGRHGIEIGQLTDGTLAVELLNRTSPPAGFSHPDPLVNAGATLEQMLIKLARFEGFQAFKGAFLEFDCGLGANCRAAKKIRLMNRGFDEVVGVDTMEWCLQEATRKTKEESKKDASLDGIRYHRCSLGSGGMTFESSSGSQHGHYGVVWMHDALCRVSRRSALLKSVRLLLRDQGYLLFTDWIQVRRAAQDEWQTFCLSAGLVDLETELSYRKLLKQAGFEILLMRRFDREMKEFFDTAKSKLIDTGIQDTHARVTATFLETAVRLVAEGPSGLEGFDAAPFELPTQVKARAEQPVGTNERASFLPSTPDLYEYHKEGFLGWLWVIARPDTSAPNLPPDLEADSEPDSQDSDDEWYAGGVASLTQVDLRNLFSITP